MKKKVPADWRKASVGPRAADAARGRARSKVAQLGSVLVGNREIPLCLRPEVRPSLSWWARPEGLPTSWLFSKKDSDSM